MAQQAAITPSSGPASSAQAGTGQPPALTVRNLSKRFDGTPVVSELSIDVRPGELLSLLGPSGCGKTTTLRLIAGFERAESGSIRIDGGLVAGDRTFVEPERRRVGMVFQEYALFPHLSVARNIGFGLPRGRERSARVEEMLALVGLDGFGDRYPSDLSGGQQQRVAVARALAPGPAILLLDEPFSNLDQALRVQLRDEIRRILRAANATAVLVTHDQDEALSISDRVGVMIDGRLRQVAAPIEVHHHPADREVAEFVGDAQFLPGRADGRTVVTALGPLPLHRPAAGEVDVLIRPEMIRIHDDAAEGARGTMLESRFQGRDQILSITLVNDTLVTVRASSYIRIPAGSAVGLEVIGAVVSFPSRSG